MEQFIETIKILKANQIAFYITGSFAVHLYTNLRKFNDIDIVIKRSDIPLIENIFKKKFRTYSMEDGTKRTSLKVGIVELACFDDFIRKKKKFSFALDNNRYKEYQTYKLEGEEFKVIDPEELIIFKMLKNRNNRTKQDFLDIMKIMTLQNFSYWKLMKLALKYKSFKKIIRLIIIYRLFDYK